MAGKKKTIFKTTFAEYQSQRVIGEGGSGRVFRVVDDEGCPAAIKLLHEKNLTYKRLKRFKNEYRFLANKHHKNIIRVFDNGLSEDELPFFVMPLYEGSIRKLMDSKLPDDLALNIFSELLDGVEAAHLKGVIHRDLKPENILFNNQGTEIILTDFGIAHFTKDELFTLVETDSQERLANYQYAAPEQRERGMAVDHRADIYALGLILNELFTQQIPLGTNYSNIADVSPEQEYLDPLVTAMLSQNPNERPNSIREIRQKLNAYGKNYLSNQKLSALKRKVIPEGQIDQPLAINPPEIVDKDWRNNRLTIELDQEPNQGWINALRNMGNYSFVHGSEPSAFTFKGSTAFVNTASHDALNVSNHFKDWLPRATQKYRSNLEAEIKRRELEERKRIQAEIEKEEERRLVMSKLKP